jgi:hypothetical protein
MINPIDSKTTGNNLNPNTVPTPAVGAGNGNNPSFDAAITQAAKGQTPNAKMHGGGGVHGHHHQGGGAQQNLNAELAALGLDNPPTDNNQITGANLNTLL